MATARKRPSTSNSDSVSPLVFIGWSGKGSRSEKMAIMLRDWLGQIIQTCEPWYSEFDIASGAPWNAELTVALRSACFGILCVTPENYTNAWLNYECGVLVGRLDRHVCPLVLDDDLNVLHALPLARQMAKSALNKASVLQVVQDINSALGTKGVPEAAVNSSFEAFWPNLDFSTLPPAEKLAVRDPKDTLEEILSGIQSLSYEVSALRSQRSFAVPASIQQAIPEKELTFEEQVDGIKKLFDLLGRFVSSDGKPEKT